MYVNEIECVWIIYRDNDRKREGKGRKSDWVKEKECRVNVYERERKNTRKEGDGRQSGHINVSVCCMLRLYETSHYACALCRLRPSAYC